MKSTQRTVQKQRWMTNLLALLVCTSLLLSSVAAAPAPRLAQGETPQPPEATTETTPGEDPTPQTPAVEETPEAPAPTEETAPTAETPTEVTPTEVTPTEETPTEVTPTEEATPAPTVEPTVTPTEPVAEPTAQPSEPLPPEANYVNYHQVVIQFKDQSGLLIQGQAVGAAASASQLATLELLKDIQVTPVFPEAAAAAAEAAALAQGVDENVTAADPLSQFYQANLPQTTGYTDAKALLDKLAALDNVQEVYFEPIYLPAADYTANQTYLDPADTNNIIDATGATTPATYYALDGSRGTNVKVTILDTGWQIGHEDLGISNASLIGGSQNSSDTNHGTMVAGVIAALNNFDSGTPIGITGLAAQSELQLASYLSLGMATAISKATLASRAGDIIVIPTQILQAPPDDVTAPAGCATGNLALSFGSMPVEYASANYAAIQAATEKGVIVIEAAGNGAMNLDHSRYANKFKRSSRDSGAIVVGAGTSADRTPMCFSNYGSRVDVQGWGENIATTGHNGEAGDDLDGGGDPNQYYTSNFGGTSGATAMVAGVAASLQGVARARNYRPLSSRQMRTILADQGLAQTDPAPIDEVIPKVGPLPQMAPTMDKWLPQGVKLIDPGFAASPEEVNVLRPTLIWQPYLSASKYRVQVSTGTTFTNLAVDSILTASQLTLTTPLASGILYYWRVAPYVTFTDGTQGWKNFSPPFQFKVDAMEVYAPTLVYPTNGEMAYYPDAVDTKFKHPSLTPQFTWKRPMSGSAFVIPTGYHVQVSTQPTFATLAFEDDAIPDDGLYVVGDKTTYNQNYLLGAALDPDTLYYWHVRSYIVQGGKTYYSPWTEARKIYTPLVDSGALVAPTLTDTNSLRPTMDWTDVANARGYQAGWRYERTVIATGVMTTSKLATLGTIGIPTGETVPPATFILKSSLPATTATYNYDVYLVYRVLGKYGYSDWSAEASITPTANPPTAPKALAPRNKVDTTFNPYFVFSVPTGAVSYELQVSVESDFDVDPPVEAVKTTTGAGVPDPLYPLNTKRIALQMPGGLTPDTKYFWRVRSQNAGGDISTWSSVSYFYTSPPAPAGLAITANTSLRPTFNWGAVATAQYYTVEVSKYDTFKSILAKGNTLGTLLPFEFTTTLPRSEPDKVPPVATTLYWRVRAVGKYGASAWTSDLGGFVTPDPPLPPTPILPKNGAVLANFQPLLDWNPSLLLKSNPTSNPVSYEFQISKTIRFVGADIVFTQANVVDTRYQLNGTELTDSGTYYWRVRAENALGETSIWSPIARFVTPGIIRGTVSVWPGGAPVANAQIEVVGRGIAAITDATGTFTINSLPRGTYRLRTTHPLGGHMLMSYDATVDSGVTTAVDFQLVPIPAADSGITRIVLTWEKYPEDADAHLWLPSGNKYHISKGDQGNLAGFPDATLYGNVATGYGPEVIDIDGYVTGSYVYGVYFNGDRSLIPLSKAHVYVYYEDVKKVDQTITIPPKPTADANGNTPAWPGKWWKVFTMTISGATHTFSVGNSLSDNNPGGY